MKMPKINDAQRMTDLTNEYVEKFINVADPRNYEDNKEMFFEMCITGPSMISATIIDKLAGTFGVDRKLVLEQFIKKLELALRWVDHKAKQ